MSETANEPLDETAEEDEITEEEAAQADEVTEAGPAEEDEFTEQDALAATQEIVGGDEEQ